MGELAGGQLYALQLADRLNEPVLTQWDAWGNRVDRIEVTPLWRAAEQLAARSGLIATAYERKHGAFSRVHQFALVYLFTPSTDVYTCPLAMTDGAARTLQRVGQRSAARARAAAPDLRAIRAQFWTSGQWMTERTGGSDVGLDRDRRAPGRAGHWRLYGRKWFTSATTSQMALTLARPEGNPAGGKGLALFYLETRDAQGRLDHILVNRLKDKLGTRKVPTAELTLDGTLAPPWSSGSSDGVPQHRADAQRHAHLERVCASRTCAAGSRSRATTRAGASPSARRSPRSRCTSTRSPACRPSSRRRSISPSSRSSCSGATRPASRRAEERELLRLLTPVAKLTTGEAGGRGAQRGARVLRRRGLRRGHRAAGAAARRAGAPDLGGHDQRAVARRAARASRAGARRASGSRCDRWPAEAALRGAGAARSRRRAAELAAEAASRGPAEIEAGARGFALTLGRTLALAALVRHAQWSLDHERDGRAAGRGGVGSRLWRSI